MTVAILISYNYLKYKFDDSYHEQKELERLTQEAIAAFSDKPKDVSTFETKFLFTATFEENTATEPVIKQIKVLASNLTEASQVAKEFLVNWDKNVKQFEYGITLLSIVFDRDEVHYRSSL